MSKRPVDKLRPAKSIRKKGIAQPKSVSKATVKANISSVTIPRPSLRVRKTARTRQAIIEASRRLFDKQGFDGTTLEQIAEAADIHKQTVFRYFRSKEDIALDYLHQWLKTFEEGLKARARNVDVLTYWRGIVDNASQELYKRQDLIEYVAFIDSDVKLIAQSLAIDNRYEAILAEAFSKEANVAPDKDVYSRLLAAFLIGGNRAIAAMVTKSKSLKDLRRLSLEVVDFAIHKFPKRGA